MAEHLKLGYLPFNVLQSAAKQGVLPSRITSCSIPKCPGCLFSKAKQKAWRHNGDTNPVYKLVTKPGECVSMDHLMSSTPGLIEQNVGKLTTKRYTCATVFVDHYSGLDFVYPQESTTAVETIEAKRAFERFAAQQGVTVQHYHADNGAEYMALSAALRDVIYVIQLLDELRSQKVGILPPNTMIKCKVFEDNAPPGEVNQKGLGRTERIIRKGQTPPSEVKKGGCKEWNGGEAVSAMEVQTKHTSATRRLQHRTLTIRPPWSSLQYKRVPTIELHSQDEISWCTSRRRKALFRYWLAQAND
jgi:hypothetical protein